MILVDSLYINNSGGKILFEYLINKLFENKLIDNYIFIIDSRLSSEVVNEINAENIFITEAGEYNRYLVYKTIFLKYNIDNVFCFSNIPPSIFLRINCRVYIYFHNILFLDSSFSNYSFYQRIVLALKILYIKFNSKSSHIFIVQTSLMKESFRNHLFFKNCEVVILPFFDDLRSTKMHKDKLHQYFYPAEGAPQKNHVLLFNVWEKLFNYGMFPKLILTLDNIKYPHLIAEIDRLKLLGVNIVNLGYVKKKVVLDYYKHSKYVIFPSLNESFGLPLVESAQLGCHLITPNLEYVNNVIETNAKYDVTKNDLYELIIDIEINKLLTIPPTIKIKNKITTLIKLIDNNYV